MYDLVSELNASKTQVFECKQDCGRYLSYHCHMQSHSCEYCSCVVCVSYVCLPRRLILHSNLPTLKKWEFTMIHQWLMAPLWIRLQLLVLMFRLLIPRVLLLMLWLLMMIVQLLPLWRSRCYHFRSRWWDYNCWYRCSSCQHLGYRYWCHGCFWWC